MPEPHSYGTALSPDGLCDPAPCTKEVPAHGTLRWPRVGIFHGSGMKRNALIFLVEEVAQTDLTLQTFRFQPSPIFWWGCFLIYAYPARRNEALTAKDYPRIDTRVQEQM